MPLVDWKSLRNLPPETIEVKAREILEQMTLDQKLNQMTGDQNLVRGGIAMLRRYNAVPICAGTPYVRHPSSRVFRWPSGGCNGNLHLLSCFDGTGCKLGS